MKDTTIYEIATKAGVSAATVSRVINNYAYVQKDTRARVLKILSENNFKPNDTARSLVTKTSKIIGIMIADFRTNQHTYGVYYIEHEFFKYGYSCLIYNTGSDFEQQAKYIQLLSQRKVDALVLMGSIYQNKSVQNAIMVNMPNTPVAICNGYLDGPNIYGVVTDEVNGLKSAVEIVCNNGYKNPAFITNKITPSNSNKIEGFKLGCKQFLGLDTPPVYETKDDVQSITDTTLEVLKNYPDVDVLFYSEDFLALVGLRALKTAGIDVPSKIGVVGLNNSRYSEISNPSLSSIDTMLYDASLISVRNIIDVLKGERVTHKMIIEAKFVKRESI